MLNNCLSKNQKHNYGTSVCMNIISIMFLLHNTGIQGFSDIEEYIIGAAHGLDTLNFLSEVLFIFVLLTLWLMILIFVLVLCTDIDFDIDGIKKKVGTLLYTLIAFLLIVSIIMDVGNIVYSFYIASQVYEKFDKFQQGQVNCTSSVYYSPFVFGIFFFNYIFVDIGLVLLVCFWFIFDFRNSVLYY